MLGNPLNFHFLFSLFQVMKDPNAVSQQTTQAVQAVALIFYILKLRSVPYLQHILPPFIHIIRTGEPQLKEFLLQQLGQIISVVRKHIRIYLDDIFKVLRELWNTNSAMQLPLFSALDQIVIALGGEFRNYVPHLIPHILRALNHDQSARKEVTLKLMGALQNFGTNLEDYVNLLIPPILAHFNTTISSTSAPLASSLDKSRDNVVKLAALKTIEAFCDDLRLVEYSSRIVHAIMKLIEDNCNDKTLTSAAMDTLTKFVLQMGSKYSMYVVMVGRLLAKHKIVHEKYEMVVAKIVDGLDVGELVNSVHFQEGKPNSGGGGGVGGTRRRRDPTAGGASSGGGGGGGSEPGSQTKRSAITIKELRAAFHQSSRQISKEDWLEWLRKLNIFLIKESPAIALKSCYPIAQSCVSVARELFNPAFLSCWNELNEVERKVG